jgi:hypothetical protein
VVLRSTRGPLADRCAFAIVNFTAHALRFHRARATFIAKFVGENTRVMALVSAERNLGRTNRGRLDLSRALRNGGVEGRETVKRKDARSSRSKSRQRHSRDLRELRRRHSDRMSEQFARDCPKADDIAICVHGRATSFGPGNQINRQSKK